MAIFNPFKKTYTEQEQRMFNFLKQNFFFQSLTERELLEFLDYMYLRKFENDEAIFFRGDPAQAFYLLRSGVVTLNIDLEGKFEKLTRIYPTQNFGENALLPERYRITNAICSSDTCEVYVIPSTNIFQIFEGNPKLRAKMMTALSSYLSNQFTRLLRSYRESFGFFELSGMYRRLMG